MEWMLKLRTLHPRDQKCRYNNRKEISILNYDLPNAFNYIRVSPAYIKKGI